MDVAPPPTKKQANNQQTDRALYLYALNVDVAAAERKHTQLFIFTHGCCSAADNGGKPIINKPVVHVLSVHSERGRRRGRPKTDVHVLSLHMAFALPPTTTEGT